MTIHITALYTYPIKSCGRIQHERIAVAERGLLHDRRWMVVGADDSAFLTQRELPRMALVQPAFTDSALTLSAPGMSALDVPLAMPADAPTMPVVVWRDTAIAHDEGSAAAEWLSAFLAHPVRLVRMADAHYRRVDPVYSPESAQVGFADGYPILLVSESSLDELNIRLQLRGKAPIPMARFRPNIVISGAPAFAEDHWSAFAINGIDFEGVKLCARCVVTTVDQETGEAPDPKEPTATLATFRNHERGVLFGQNVVHRGQGVIAVGDAVQISA
jgi:uncharacterized protein YcbX